MAGGKLRSLDGAIGPTCGTDRWKFKSAPDSPFPDIDWRRLRGGGTRRNGHIKRPIDTTRIQGIPVIYTTGVGRAEGWDAGGWRWKNRRRSGGTAVNPGRQRDRQCHRACAAGHRGTKAEVVVFFGSNLAAYLNLLGRDSVIIVGTTTSGCVRATAVDAFSLNYRVVVAEEGCFDGSEAGLAISLCDLHAKYADVLKMAEIDAHLRSLPVGLFELPRGHPSIVSAAPRACRIAGGRPESNGLGVFRPD
jgi:nicotinamidase-related amidase